MHRVASSFLECLIEDIMSEPKPARSVRAEDFSEEQLKAALEKKQKAKTTRELKEKALSENMLKLFAPDVKVTRMELHPEFTYNGAEMAIADVVGPNDKPVRVTAIFNF